MRAGKDLSTATKVEECRGPRNMFRLPCEGLSVHNVSVSIRQAREFGALEYLDGNVM